jgi:hypothetical protein
MDILKKSAQVLAYVFHPLNIPLMGLVLLLYTPSIPESFLVIDSFYFAHPAIKTMLLLLFGLFTWAAPLLTVLLLKRSGDIESLEMDNREERNVPIGFMIFFYMIFFALIYFYLPNNVVPKSVSAILLGGFFGLIGVRFLNNSMKISLHATGMGMLTGAVYTHYLNMSSFPFWVMPTLFLLSGIVISSRVFLRKHDLQESLLGYGLGFLSQLIIGILFFN